LGERFNGIEEVVGSIPSGSTNSLKFVFFLEPEPVGAGIGGAAPSPLRARDVAATEPA
jgi:hypothetical protein